jgi:hypothetical protein
LPSCPKTYFSNPKPPIVLNLAYLYASSIQSNIGYL